MNIRRFTFDDEGNEYLDPDGDWVSYVGHREEIQQLREALQGLSDVVAEFFQKSEKVDKYGRLFAARNVAEELLKGNR